VGAGFWNLTDREAASFRAYLLKGGFAVFEDFDGAAQWANFEAQMRRVLPDGRFVRLDRTHPHLRFVLRDQGHRRHRPPDVRHRAELLRDLRGQRPAKRLMVIANFDNDVPEYWEWYGEGLFPFDASNEAYKLGVNYLIYGMTH
jgi:hypothetical protein